MSFSLFQATLWLLPAISAYYATPPLFHYGCFHFIDDSIRYFAASHIFDADLLFATLRFTAFSMLMPTFSLPTRRHAISMPPCYIDFLPYFRRRQVCHAIVVFFAMRLFAAYFSQNCHLFSPLLIRLFSSFTAIFHFHFSRWFSSFSFSLQLTACHCQP